MNPLVDTFHWTTTDGYEYIQPSDGGVYRRKMNSLDGYEPVKFPQTITITWLNNPLTSKKEV